MHLGCLVLPAGGLQDFLTDSAAAAREGMFMHGGIPKSLEGRALGGELPQAAPGRGRDELPAAVRAERDDPPCWLA